LFITEKNIELLSDTVNGFVKYKLPVVYVSKTFAGEDPVDVWRLAGRLKGVAHVLVEEDIRLNGRIRERCADRNEYHGAVGIYFPHSAYGHRKYLYRAYEGIDSVLTEKVIRSVILFSSSRVMDSLYTWQGVKNAVLRSQLNERAAELVRSESEKLRVSEEADELLESADEDMRNLKKQVEELTASNERLLYENEQLRKRTLNQENRPLLVTGEEEEFFSDEIKAIVLDVLLQALTNSPDGSRRQEILEDILKNNSCSCSTSKRSEQLKAALKESKSLSGVQKRQLQDLGFEIIEGGKHYKLIYYGDSRYQATMSKTPSDSRSGLNLASAIIKKMF
jgi:hypothetical protein